MPVRTNSSQRRRKLGKAAAAVAAAALLAAGSAYLLRPTPQVMQEIAAAKPVSAQEANAFVSESLTKLKSASVNDRKYAVARLHEPGHAFNEEYRARSKPYDFYEPPLWERVSAIPDFLSGKGEARRAGRTDRNIRAIMKLQEELSQRLFRYRSLCNEKKLLIAVERGLSDQALPVRLEAYSLARQIAFGHKAYAPTPRLPNPGFSIPPASQSVRTGLARVLLRSKPAIKADIAGKINPVEARQLLNFAEKQKPKGQRFD